MPAKKIVVCNHHDLMDPRLADFHEPTWNRCADLSKFKMSIGFNSVRYGKNILPFDHTDLMQMFNITAPELDITFTKSMADITNSRACNLLATCTDRPWIVYWSGGIDSTAMITAILKNSSAADRERMTVACNRISFYENPKFFTEHIKPNFATVDSTWINVHQYLQTHYLIDGDLSDQLHCSHSIVQTLLCNNPEILNQNFRRSPDHLLDMLTQAVDRPFAVWYYENCLENIDSTNIPVETNFDFYWWYAFNFMWTAVKARDFFQLLQGKMLDSFCQYQIKWYDTTDYQQWAMNNRQPGMKYGKNLGEYKTELKRYIYEFNSDAYYYKFAMKRDSISRYHGYFPWFCLLDDKSILTLDQDLDQILELLPAHIIT